MGTRLGSNPHKCMLIKNWNNGRMIFMKFLPFADAAAAVGTAAFGKCNLFPMIVEAGAGGEEIFSCTLHFQSDKMAGGLLDSFKVLKEKEGSLEALVV